MIIIYRKKQSSFLTSFCRKTAYLFISIKKSSPFLKKHINSHLLLLGLYKTCNIFNEVNILLLLSHPLLTVLQICIFSVNRIRRDKITYTFDCPIFFDSVGIYSFYCPEKMFFLIF